MLDISEKRFLAILPQINFLLSLLIVFHHGFISIVRYNGSFSPFSYGLTVSIERYLYNISECAVPFFFFLSAYLFYRTYDGSWSQYLYKIKRRFWSLLIPYSIFGTIGYVKVRLFSPSEMEGGGISYLSSLWLSNTMPLCFIRELIAFTIFAPLIWHIKNSIWMSVLISSILICLTSLNIVSQRSFLYWMPLYLLGAMLNKNMIICIAKRFDHSSFQFLAIIFLCIYCVAAWFLPNGFEKVNIINCLLFTLFRLSTPFVMCVVIWFIIKNNIPDIRFMHYSFFVYCMHAPVITLTGIVYDRTLYMLFNYEIVKYFTVVILAYIVCVLSAQFIERFFPRCWSIMNGKR